MNTNGAVAAGHPLTVEAAVDILNEGGNAMDAALAGVFTSMVAEPVLTGLLGGGMLVVRQPDGGQYLLDFFARVPGIGGRPIGSDLEFECVRVNFRPAHQEFHIGRGAAAVPGTLAGLFDAHRRWGTTPLERLVEHACHLAREGIVLTEQMSFFFNILEPILVYTAQAAELFAPKGRLLAPGQRFFNPDLADLLERLAVEGLDGPTRQQVDEAILSTFGGSAGLLTRQDLRLAVPVLRDLNPVRYRDAKVCLPPPPLMGGSLVALGLKLLEQLPRTPYGTPEAMLWMAQVQKQLSEARRDPPAKFLSGTAIEAYLASVRAALWGLTMAGSTTHISVIDPQGMAVGITHTNGEGCGVMVEGTGVMMNNFLGEEDINPGGFHRQKTGSHMVTNMCPTLIDGPGGFAVLGTGGSNRIRTAILQVAHNLVVHEMSASEAITASRIHIEDGVLNLELVGVDPEVVEALTSRFEQRVLFDKPNLFFGGVHLVVKGDQGFDGCGDPRRGGVFSMARC